MTISVELNSGHEMQRRRVETIGAKGQTEASEGIDHDSQAKSSKYGTRLPTLALGAALLLVMASSMLLFPGSSNSPSVPLHGSTASTAGAPRIKNEPRSDSKGYRSRAQNAASSGVDYHIVFSTGCSLYQDWQSYVFFFQAMITQQPGIVTRIVSGCNDEDEAALRKIFADQILPMAPDRFKIHFTPDYSKIKDTTQPFVYFNKPFGMRHWMQNALGFPDNPENEDAIVILMDPDQLILRPFTNNNFTNTEWQFIKKGDIPRSRVEHGKPMGQLYGFGLQWKQKINMTLVSPSEKSPVDQMGFSEAQAGYIVGPPYVATGTFSLLYSSLLAFTSTYTGAFGFRETSRRHVPDCLEVE
jgi:hypothetical protein